MTDSELRDCLREIQAERSKTQARIREIAARQDGEKAAQRTISDKSVH
jgi:hypothetical protein